jgi:phage major head subunit gpT-like protein
MPAVTPRFTLKLEDRMQVIIEREYARLTADLWWQSVARVRPSTGRKELITWLLSTAQIKDMGQGGNMAFDDLVATYTTIENKHAGGGLRLKKDRFEDTDGGGMDIAAQWSSDMGNYMAYWPQKQVTHLLKNGHTASLYTGYDGKALFATDHPYNQFRVGLGTFQNIFTGAASGAYPGACPIDESVTADVALTNLSKILAYIATIKMPNGEDPRFLRPEALIVPPRLLARAVQLTSAKFLAGAASSGGGGMDVEALIKALGYATPKVADELAGFESDTTFFVVCKQVAQSQLGAAVYQEREPFYINFYGAMTESQLNRMDELEWQCKGRNAVSAGHPFLIFKCKGS